MKGRLQKSLLLLFAIIVSNETIWADDITRAYSGSSSGNFGTSNVASSVGLTATDESVITPQGPASDNVGNNNSCNIRLHYNASGSNTLTVNAVEAATYSIASSITSGKHYIIGNGSNRAMGGQKEDNRGSVSVSTEDDVVTVNGADVAEFVIYGPNADGYYEIYDPVADGYLYAASSSNSYLRTQATNDKNGLWTITFEGDGHAVITAQGTNTRNLMRYNHNSETYSCYKGTSYWTIYLYEKDGEATPTESKTLNGSGYATYCSQNALDFSQNSDVTAWIISDANSTTGVITFNQIMGKAPAGIGMLLKGEPSANVTMTYAVGKDNLESNLLEGIITATDVTDNQYYGLSGNQFVPVNAGTVPAGKALLPVNALTSNIRSYTFVFVDPTTGITETQNVNAEEFGEIFNLAGQRVSQQQRGVNIINGKKVLHN